MLRTHGTTGWFLHKPIAEDTSKNGSSLQDSCLGNPMGRGALHPWGCKDLDTTQQLNYTHAVLCLVVQSFPWGSSIHADSAGKNPGVGCHGPLQGVFLTQGQNPGLPHCRWILYHLSLQGSPIKWIAYPFSRWSSRPGIEPGSPELQVDSLPAELPGKPKLYICVCVCVCVYDLQK